MRKKILVVEDQMESLKTAFDLANLRKFNGDLQIISVLRSQDIVYTSLMKEYDLIFNDITLASRSQLNGYGIIMKIMDSNYFLIDRIVILSVNTKIKDGLKQYVLPESIEVILKPVTFRQLEEILSKYISTN